MYVSKPDRLLIPRPNRQQLLLLPGTCPQVRSGLHPANSDFADRGVGRSELEFEEIVVCVRCSTYRECLEGKPRLQRYSPEPRDHWAI